MPRSPGQWAADAGGDSGDRAVTGSARSPVPVPGPTGLRYATCVTLSPTPSTGPARRPLAPGDLRSNWTIPAGRRGRPLSCTCPTVNRCRCRRTCDRQRAGQAADRGTGQRADHRRPVAAWRTLGRRWTARSGGARRIVIVGTGLTMVDLALAITAGRPTAVIHAVSRHGAPAPFASGDVPAANRGPYGCQSSPGPPAGPAGRPDVAGPLDDAAGPGSWIDVMDSLRPLVPGLWRRMPDRTRGCSCGTGQVLGSASAPCAARDREPHHHNARDRAAAGPPGPGISVYAGRRPAGGAGRPRLGRLRFGRTG